MGMYDQEANFEEHFKVGDRFIVTNMEYVGKLNTKFGQGDKSIITVEKAGVPERYSMLGIGFANLARRASPEDFPHVAEYVVLSLSEDRTLKVLRFVNVTPTEFRNGNNGPPLDPEGY